MWECPTSPYGLRRPTNVKKKLVPAALAVAVAFALASFAINLKADDGHDHDSEIQGLRAGHDRAQPNRLRGDGRHRHHRRKLAARMPTRVQEPRPAARSSAIGNRQCAAFACRPAACHDRRIGLLRLRKRQRRSPQSEGFAQRLEQRRHATAVSASPRPFASMT